MLGLYQKQGNWEMSKLENMFSLLNLVGEDDGENDREVTQTSSTSIQETAASKSGWCPISSRMQLSKVLDYTR